MDLIARVAKHFEDSANTKLNAVDQMAAPIAAAIETLTRQTLKRVEEDGFEPEHRVPLTNAVGQVLKKPKKPKKPKIAGTPGPAERKGGVATPQVRQGRSGARAGGRKSAPKTVSRRSS